MTDIHAIAMRRFDEAAVPQLEMRADALAARRFATIPGAQWEDSGWSDTFENSIRIEIPKIQRGIRKLETDYRENRIIPDFRPDGKEADQDTADLLDGLHRADGAQYKSQQARDNAYSEAAMGGFGAYRMANVEQDEYDLDDDYQRINPAITIADADQRVFFDPQSILYDKSDAKYAFVLTSYSKEGYTERFDVDQPVTWIDPKLRPTFDWYEGEKIFAAEYYVKEDKREVCYKLKHSVTGKSEVMWRSDIDDADEWLEGQKLAGYQVTEKRKKRCRVRKYILSGQDVLEDMGCIAGPNIPIVPVYGNRAYVDGMERFWGYVQPRMDAQRLYNSSVSKIAETNALSPSRKPIFTPEMVQGHEQSWARNHIDRTAYALINPLYDPNTGNIVATGPLAYLEPPDVSPAQAALLQIAGNDLVEDDQDGAAAVKANTSVEAMDVAASRVDAKSGIYMDNMRQSVQREGEIYLGMAPEVYHEDEREVNVQSEDGDDGQEMLKENYTDKTGKNSVRHDLTRGRYKVFASVSEATATRRDKTVRSMFQLADVSLQAGSNDLAEAAIITAISNSDGEGMEDYKAFARKKGLSIGLFKPNEEEQAAAAQQQEQEAPDPTMAMVEAQTKDLMASAEKKTAEGMKVEAQTMQILQDLGQPKILRGNQAR